MRPMRSMRPTRPMQPTRPIRPMRLQRLLARPLRSLEELGRQLSFYGRSLAWTGRTVRRYKKELLRRLAEGSCGRGALAVVGGTVVVIAFLSVFTGTEVGLQGYAALNQFGPS